MKNSKAAQIERSFEKAFVAASCLLDSSSDDIKNLGKLSNIVAEMRHCATFLNSPIESVRNDAIARWTDILESVK